MADGTNVPEQQSFARGRHEREDMPVSQQLVFVSVF